MNLHARLDRLEQRRRSGGLEVIRVRGGLPGAGLTTATVGDREMTSDEGESVADFEARAIAAAKTARAGFVVIGGLPA